MLITNGISMKLNGTHHLLVYADIIWVIKNNDMSGAGSTYGGGVYTGET